MIAGAWTPESLRILNLWLVNSPIAGSSPVWSRPRTMSNPSALAAGGARRQQHSDSATNQTSETASTNESDDAAVETDQGNHRRRPAEKKTKAGAGASDKA